MFQSGIHDVESLETAAQNVSGKEDIMAIALIPVYMVYNGFYQDISAALVYKRLHDIQQDSHMRDHALALLHSCMLER